jgi:hypothetical protein
MWPPPGRVLAVGPAHTFADLARAIDGAFARWDRAHLCQFRLSDGRTITDRESAEELADSLSGALGAAPLILDRTKVLRTVEPGEEFCYLFDFGDGWTHRCTLEAGKIDPLEELGVVPDLPLPSWGVGQHPRSVRQALGGRQRGGHVAATAGTSRPDADRLVAREGAGACGGPGGAPGRDLPR